MITEHIKVVNTLKYRRFLKSKHSILAQKRKSIGEVPSILDPKQKDSFSEGCSSSPSFCYQVNYVMDERDVYSKKNKFAENSKSCMMGASAVKKKSTASANPKSRTSMNNQQRDVLRASKLMHYKNTPGFSRIVCSNRNENLSYTDCGGKNITSPKHLDSTASTATTTNNREEAPLASLVPPLQSLSNDEKASSDNKLNQFISPPEEPSIRPGFENPFQELFEISVQPPPDPVSEALFKLNCVDPKFYFSNTAINNKNAKKTGAATTNTTGYEGGAANLAGNNPHFTTVANIPPSAIGYSTAAQTYPTNRDTVVPNSRIVNNTLQQQQQQQQHQQHQHNGAEMIAPTANSNVTMNNHRMEAVGQRRNLNAFDLMANSTKNIGNQFVGPNTVAVNNIENNIAKQQRNHNHNRNAVGGIGGPSTTAANLNNIAMKNIECAPLNNSHHFNTAFTANNRDNLRVVAPNNSLNLTAMNNLELGALNLNPPTTHMTTDRINLESFFPTNFPSNVQLPLNLNPPNNACPMANFPSDNNIDFSKVNIVLNSRYKILKMLGKGSFGKVFRCFDFAENKLVALKIIMSDNNASITQSSIEKSILQELNMHDPNRAHVVRLLDEFMWNHHRCLVFELLDMNLYEVLQVTKGRGLDLNTLRTITFKLLLSMTLLFDLDIIHCDLKPENIMVAKNCKNLVKLVDFGSSCKVGGQIYSYIQSRFYRAPEVMLELNYSKPIDIWSLGCLLAEMSTCEPLFCGRNEVDQMAQIIHYLGFPPSDMILASKKASRFFVLDPLDGSIRFVADSSANFNGAFSKKLKDYLIRNKFNHHSLSHNIDDGLLFRGLSGVDDSFENFIFSMLNYNPEKRANPYDLMFHPFIFSITSRILQLPGNIRAVGPSIFRTIIQQYRSCSTDHQCNNNRASNQQQQSSSISSSTSSNLPLDGNFTIDPSRFLQSNNYLNYNAIPQPSWLNSWFPPHLLNPPQNNCDNLSVLPSNDILFFDQAPYYENFFAANDYNNNNNILLQPSITTINNNNNTNTNTNKPVISFDLRSDVNPYIADNNLTSNSPSTVTPCHSKVIFKPLLVHNTSGSNVHVTSSSDFPAAVLDHSNSTAPTACYVDSQSTGNNIIQAEFSNINAKHKQLNNYFNFPVYDEKGANVQNWFPGVAGFNPIHVTNNFNLKL